MVLTQKIASDQGGGRWTSQKFFACGAPNTQHHLQKDRFRPGGGRWTSQVGGLGGGYYCNTFKSLQAFEKNALGDVP